MAMRSTEDQLKNKMISLNRYGESKHKAKKEKREKLRKEGEPCSMENTAPDGIYSRSTLKNYEQVGQQFIKWLREERGVLEEKKSLTGAIRQYAAEYLDWRQAKGLSVYTLQREASALAKLSGKPIEWERPSKKDKKIVRSRKQAVRDGHFSTKNNQLAIDLASATGSRRDDLRRMRWTDFVEIDGRLYVWIFRSKGGRNRLSPVLPSMEETIRQYLKENKGEEYLESTWGRTAEQTEGMRKEEQPILPRVHGSMDVHSYRRQYAQNLYAEVEADLDAKQAILKQYPPMTDRKRKSTSDIYISQKDAEGRQFKGSRSSVYVVTQALGHARLTVAVKHYLV